MVSRYLAGVLRNLADRIDPPPRHRTGFYIRPGVDPKELEAELERQRRVNLSHMGYR
jgi:hypothetical protein